MHVASPILAYDCGFNRHIPEDAPVYFAGVNELADLVADLSQIDNGTTIGSVANRRQR